MISLKGLFVGLVFSLLGTIVYALSAMRRLSPNGQLVYSGPQVGIDVRLLQAIILRSPAYWVMILLLAAGCALMHFWHRPTA